MCGSLFLVWFFWGVGLGFFLCKHKAFQIGNKNMQIVILVVVSVVHQLLKYSWLCSAIMKLYYNMEVFLLFNFKCLCSASWVTDWGTGLSVLSKTLCYILADWLALLTDLRYSYASRSVSFISVWILVKLGIGQHC